MMESINEFIKTFRERLSSPFFFSFFISWIFANWKVTVALLWYNSELYPKEGDLIKFIETNTSNWKSIGFPLIGAIFYTGLVRNLVAAFVAFGTKWGGNWNLDISKGSKIPMSKFLTYRNLYIQSNKDLEKVIEDERKTIEDFDKQRQQALKLGADNVTLTGEVTRLKSDNANLEFKRSTLDEMVKSLQAEVEKQEALIKKNENLIAKYKDYKFLDGTWHFRYDNAMRNVHFEETYQIVDGTFQAKAGTRTESVYQIAYFFHDSVRQKLFLVLKYIPETTEANFIHRLNSQPEQFEARSEKEFVTYHRARYEPVIIQDLRVESSGILKGTENIEALISYSRIS